MHVKVEVDEQQVIDYVNENNGEGSILPDDPHLEALISDVIEAVMESLTFQFDRDNVEVIADVIPIRGGIHD